MSINSEGRLVSATSAPGGPQLCPPPSFALCAPGSQPQLCPPPSYALCAPGSQPCAPLEDHAAHAEQRRDAEQGKQPHLRGGGVTGREVAGSEQSVKQPACALLGTLWLNERFANARRRQHTGGKAMRARSSPGSTCTPQWLYASPGGRTLVGRWKHQSRCSAGRAGARQAGCQSEVWLGHRTRHQARGHSALGGAAVGQAKPCRTSGPHCAACPYLHHGCGDDPPAQGDAATSLM